MADAIADRLIAEAYKADRVLASGRRSEALLIYHEVARAADRHAGVQYRLGHLCLNFGDVDQALGHFEIAAEEEPGNVHFVAALGLAYQNSGAPERARETLERALQMQSDLPEVLHGLGNHHMECADYDHALEYLQRACDAKPGDAAIRSSLARTLTKLDRHRQAIDHARKAVKQDRSNRGAHLVLCRALTEVGRLDDAEKHLQSQLRRQPDFGAAYELLARVRKFSEADAAIIKKAEKALEQGMSASDRYRLHFGLGKMHDDCGNYDRAFAHFERANLLQKPDYDTAQDRQLLEDMKKAFRAVADKTRSGLGHSSRQPVFVVGMPRSGTTLIERFIASHPAAAGAGELPEIPRLAAGIFPVADRRRTAARARSELTAPGVLDYAESYLDVLGRAQPGAERIVDKMPSNFFFLGLITTLFPNAAIIHARRNPLDTCLSCYFQSFAALPWSNDLGWIADMYRNYRNAMSFWHEVLPAGKVLDVAYEQLVEEPETHARRMIEHCGLEWDDAVLNFSGRKGIVKTASVAQARQPIYKTSKARWQHYASHIDDLARDLGEYLGDERESLQEYGIDIRRGSLLKRLWQ